MHYNGHCPSDSPRSPEQQRRRRRGDPRARPAPCAGVASTCAGERVRLASAACTLHRRADACACVLPSRHAVTTPRHHVEPPTAVLFQRHPRVPRRRGSRITVAATWTNSRPRGWHARSRRRAAVVALKPSASPAPHRCCRRRRLLRQVRAVGWARLLAFGTRPRTACVRRTACEAVHAAALQLQFQVRTTWSGWPGSTGRPGRPSSQPVKPAAAAPSSLVATSTSSTSAKQHDLLDLDLDCATPRQLDELKEMRRAWQPRAPAADLDIIRQ
eukprot:239441-Chlamydomonas_euryale.AAC.10